jgi:hypothetical protein
MNIIELHYFIGSCLTLDSRPDLKEKITQSIRANTISWNRFVWICSNHLVLQTIYVKFRDNNILEFIPVDLATHLKEIYTLNLERNREILKQIEELTKILNSRNIQPLFIKGAGNLIDNLYDDLGERILSDIDLLVPEEQFLDAAKCLESVGYSSEQKLYESYSEMMHYPSLHRDDVVAPVEVHKSPVMLRWSGKFNNAKVSGDRKPIADMDGCFVPSDEHKFAINFIHSQLSNKANITGLVSFRDLYDVYRLSARVNMALLIDKIPYKVRARSYIRLSAELFDINDEKSVPATISSRLYLLHYKLNLSSGLYYHTFRISRSIGELIFVDYLGKIPRLIFNRKLRKTVFRKLSSKEWYKEHLKSYRERFR